MKKYFFSALFFVIAVSMFASCGGKKNDDPLIDTDGYKGDMSEYISVPDLSDIFVYDSEVEEEWQKIVLGIRRQNIVYYDAGEDAKAEINDRVNINYSPITPIDPRLAVSLTLNGYEVVIGSGSTIGEYTDENGEVITASFESQLIGASAGDTVTVNVTFPDDYVFTDSEGKNSDALAGKLCEFKVKINRISHGELPELSAPMISSYTAGEYTAIGEYRDDIYDYYRSAIAYDEILKGSEIKKYPEEELYNARLNYISGVIEEKYSGVKLDDEDVKTLYDSLYAEADAHARSAVFERMVLEYLFAKCGITLTESEYQSMLERDYCRSYNYYYMYHGVTAVGEYENYLGKDNLVLQYKYQKLLDVLPSYVTIVPVE